MGVVKRVVGWGSRLGGWVGLVKREVGWGSRLGGWVGVVNWVVGWVLMESRSCDHALERS